MGKQILFIIIIVFHLQLKENSVYAQQITLNMAMVIEVAETNHNQQLLSPQVNQIKEKYLRLVYYNHLLNLHYTFKEKTEKLVEIVNLKYKHGDIDQLEQISWINKYYEIENQTGILESEQLIVQNQLKMLLLTDRDIMPVETTLFLYPIDKTDKDYEDFFTHLEGYPEDSIKLDTSVFLYFKRKENALLNIVAMQNQLQHYEDYVLPVAETYNGYAGLYLESEEIEFTEYFMYISKVFSIQKEYIDIINRYNEAALKMELLLKQHE
ncbi:MAG: hypothetical protein JXB49_10780 [Bacteroidales bacterium]|nr:hypothetical protein [Bacteroidales bacterium]